MATIETKAIVARRPGQLPRVEPLTLALPPAPGTVLVRVEASGLCHSDVSLWDSASCMPAPLPQLLGHEGAGVVEAVGAGVRSLRPGDAVALIGRQSCGRCALCRAGKPVLCAEGLQPIPGTEGVGPVRPRGFVGTLSERMIVAEASAVRVSAQEVPLRVRSLFGCLLTTAWGAVVENGRIVAGMRVAVFGAGGVGLAVAMLARAVGAAAVVVYDRLERRRSKAISVGATAFAALPPRSPSLDAHPDLIDRTPEQAGPLLKAIISAAPEVFVDGGGFDVCFDTTGCAELLETEAVALRSTGTLVVVGLPPWGDKGTLHIAEFVLREKRIVASFGAGADPNLATQQLLRMYKSGLLPAERLLSDKEYTSLEDFGKFVEDMAAGRIDGRALLVFPPKPKL